MAVAFFNTPDHESSHGSSDDAIVSSPPSLPTLRAVLGTPLPPATPSPRAVWRALGLEPMTEDYDWSRDKEAPSRTPQPLYLRFSSVVDPEPVELVERVLSSDKED